MFFNDADSITTYTSAVQELLRGLVKAKGGQGSFIKDSDMIVAEYAKEFLAIINRPQNFFKHADRDPHAVLDFQPKSVAFCLLDCVQMYEQVTGKKLREGLVFTVWLMAAYPKIVKPGA